MAPTKVQHKPGGSWHPWVSGSVDPSTLRMKQQMAMGSAQSEVYINGCVVHGLRFEGEKEWNVKEGWK